MSIKNNFGFDLTKKFIYQKKRNSREYTKRKVKSINDTLILEHLAGIKTISLPLYEKTKYVVIDIDQRSNPLHRTDDITDMLCDDEYFGYPFFAEQSLETNGFHLYFQYDSYLSKAKAKAIEGYFKDTYNYIIEIKVAGDNLRLPFSTSYIPLAGFSLESFDNPNEEETPEFFSNFLDPIIEVNKSSGAKEYLSRREFHYGNGTRYENQFRLGFHVLRMNNNATLDDYIEACEFWNDGTSKDMKLPDSKKLKMLESQWNFILSKFEASPFYEEKVSDWQALYKDNQLFNIRESKFKFDSEDSLKLNKILRYYYQKLKIGKIGTKSHERFIEDSIKTLEFLYGSKEYRDINGYSYNEEFKELEKGVPFGHKLQKSIAEHYNISNIRKVLLFLREIGLLEDIFLENGYSYSYKNIRYSIHYILSSIFDLYYTLIYNLKSVYGPRPQREGDYYINNVANFLSEDIRIRSLLGGKRLNERLELIRKKVKLE